jgi:glycosyltransferase involved in cell wall biosynthesis
MLSREVALYRRLQMAGLRVSFITYGDSRDLAYADRLSGIRICCNRFGLPLNMYRKMIPWLHMAALKKSHLIKTNQTSGAEVALQSARRFGKPLIVRCGYMFSAFMRRRHGADASIAAEADRLENTVFAESDRIVVTTKEMQQDILRRFPALGEKITVIPNYVDTAGFSPGHRQGGDVPLRLCYVGRLIQKQKNLLALLDAVDGLEIGLDLIGEGPLREKIEARMRRNPHIRLIGRVPHDRLAEYLKTADAFIFPSFYEGHPKALIEAMACGLPIIATDVTGINNIIRHNETGWLCAPEPGSLRGGIRDVMTDPDLRKRLGEAARAYAVNHYAIDSVVDKELNLYRSITDAEYT